MINMVVPSEQLADTAELFYLEGQRKLGLRFLARHLLQLDIQQGAHDSIEDARTALALLRAHDRLREAGELQQTLRRLCVRARAAVRALPSHPRRARAQVRHWPYIRVPRRVKG